MSDALLLVAVLAVIGAMVVLAIVGVVGKTVPPTVAIAALVPVLYALLQLLKERAKQKK